MKKQIAVLMCTALCAALAACSTPGAAPNETDELLGQAYTEVSPPLDAYMKRTLADTELSKKPTLSVDESYQLSFPFEYEQTSYSSDDPMIVAVSSDGLIVGKSGGIAMVHAVIDGLWFHFPVTVTGTANLQNPLNPYEGYAIGHMNPETVEKDIELYATQIGFTLRSGLAKDENLRYTDEFPSDMKLSACEVKYKLLTTVDYLQTKGYTDLDLVISMDESGNVACDFYADF